MKIQFLHISDIHCGYDNYTVGNMRESMPDEISRFVNSKGQKIYYTNHFYLDLGPVNIIHLNTAFICGEDNEDGSLIVGMSMLKSALRNMDIRKPAIVLAHHSFDCLTTSEQLELERFLKSKNAVLYLCGHKHVAMCSKEPLIKAHKKRGIQSK